MYKRFIIKNIILVQLFLLCCSYLFNKLISRKKDGVSWVVGVDDIGFNVYNIGLIFPNSTTVSLTKLPWFNLKYDYSINSSHKLIKCYKILYGPILLGYLAAQHSHFWYNWSSGFLLDRKYEFKFLKQINKKIVCSFVGDDIRSLRLTKDFSEYNNIDTSSNYYEKQFYSDQYENKKMYIAKIADDYSDLIFNYKFDQISYLKKEQFRQPYIYPDNKFFRNDLKFKELSKIKIIHAPSNMFLKGTPLVRAAIKRLELEGYKFEYIELMNMPNNIVIEHLREAHIVLNQFYNLVPGIFGIESMANHCATLMSANFLKGFCEIEHSKDAWLVTAYWEIYDNLKFLLDNPEKIKYYADNGYNFAYKSCTIETARVYINSILKKNGVI